MSHHQPGCDLVQLLVQGRAIYTWHTKKSQAKVHTSGLLMPYDAMNGRECITFLLHNPTTTSKLKLNFHGSPIGTASLNGLSFLIATVSPPNILSTITVFSIARARIDPILRDLDTSSALALARFQLVLAP